VEGLTLDWFGVASISTIVSGVVFIIVSMIRAKQNKELRDLLHEEVKEGPLRSSLSIIFHLYNEMIEGLIQFIAEAIHAFVSLITGLLTLNFLPPMKVKKTTSARQEYPPRVAKLFMRFVIKPADQEIILGDMQEIFHTIGNENNYFIAKIWYVWQAIWSVGAVIVRKLIRLGVWAFLADTVKKIIGG